MVDEFWLREYEQKAALPDPIAQTGRGSQFDAPAFLACLRQSLELLELDRTHDLLDVGCGNGLAEIVLSALCRSVLAVEPVESLCELARRNTAACENVRIARADGLHIPALAGSFDRVLLMNVLQLVPHGELIPLVRELHRVTRPGGRIVFAAVPDARRREAFLTPYLAGLANAKHLTAEQRQAARQRNERATWHNPVEVARLFMESGSRARVVELSEDDLDRDHRFHLVVEFEDAPVLLRS